MDGDLEVFSTAEGVRILTAGGSGSHAGRIAKTDRTCTEDKADGGIIRSNPDGPLLPRAPVWVNKPRV
jgi:hypothetical protein